MENKDHFSVGFDGESIIILDEFQRKRLECEFNLILKQYNNVIFHSLYKFKFFKTKEDQEEYLQEIYLALWSTFLKCRKDGPMEVKTMPAWIMGVAKYAIYNFRRNHHKKHDRLICTDNDYFFNAIDTEYDEEQITAVKLMVTRLPDSDRSVMEMVLDDKNLRQESLKIGMSGSYFSQKYQKALKEMKIQASKYFEHYKFDLSKLFTRPDYKGRSRSVIQLDASGRILNEYISLTEASLRSSISPNTLHRLVTSEDGYFNGFFWRYKDGPIVELVKDNKTFAMAI